MNERVIRRFIILMVVLIIAAFSFKFGWDYLNPPPGDFEVRRGDIHLGAGEWDDAIEDFNAALQKQPDHRGALMGRAIAFLNSNRDAEAEAELKYLIDYLNRDLDPEDATGLGTMAAAYANLGILYDRQGRYQDALDNYIKALETDSGAVSGPGLVDKILYEADPSTVRDRAQYLWEQLQLPESERILRVPEIDQRQRMHKP